jgi:hypothetical protein
MAFSKVADGTLGAALGFEFLLSTQKESAGE